MRRTKLFLTSLTAILVTGLIGAGSASAQLTFVVEETTRFNSVNKKERAVHCPSLSERVGGGAHINGARRAVRIQNSRPIVDGWKAVAGEVKPHFHKDWSLTVRVVCQGIENDVEESAR